jgi:hypothetical protein
MIFLETPSPDPDLVSSIAQWILPSASAILLGFLSNRLGPFIYVLRNSKLTPIVIQALDTLGPILADNIKPLGKEGVYQLIRGTIEALADGQLTADEVERAVHLFREKFDIADSTEKEGTSLTEKLWNILRRRAQPQQLSPALRSLSTNLEPFPIEEVGRQGSAS